MATIMLWGMLIMALAAWMYSIAVSLARARTLILERERQTEWARLQLEGQA
jgi:heme exporter protein C